MYTCEAGIRNPPTGNGDGVSSNVFFFSEFRGKEKGEEKTGRDGSRGSG